MGNVIAVAEADVVMKSVAFKIALFAGIAAVSAVANATVVPNDSQVNLSGTTLAASPFLAGTVIADTYRPFSMTDHGVTLAGEIEDVVIRETASGNLDFSYRILLNQPFYIPPSPGVFEVQRSSFANYTVDADSRVDTVGNLYPTVGLNFYGLIGFTYPSGNPRVEGSHYFIGSGSNATRYTYIRTNAKTYNANGTFVITAYSLNQGYFLTPSTTGYQPG